MTLVYKDRVKETTTTTGTGTYTLAGAVVSFQAFSAIGNTNTCYYAATDGTDWEVGLGTYTLAGTTLARTQILASSNANAAVNWGAGSKTIWNDVPALLFPGSNLFPTEEFTGDGTTLTCVLANVPLYSNSIAAFIGGIRQDPTRWSLSGQTITWVEAPPNLAKIEISYLVAGPQQFGADPQHQVFLPGSLTGLTTITVTGFTPGTFAGTELKVGGIVIPHDSGYWTLSGNVITRTDGVAFLATDYAEVTALANIGIAVPSNSSVTKAKLENMAQATVIGRAAAAGTGVPVDLTAAQLRDIILPVGSILQTVRATPYTTNTTTTAVIPADDTLPQNTEGTQVLTASITPLLSTSKIVAVAVLNSTPSGANKTVVFALNRDAVANSFAATNVFLNDGVTASVTLDGEFLPGDTSSHTVNVRIGPGAAGTIAFNGLGAGRLLGGAMAMTLELREVKQ